MVIIHSFNKFSTQIPLHLLVKDEVYQFLDDGKLYKAKQSDYYDPSYSIGAQHLPTDPDGDLWFEEYPISCNACRENRKFLDENGNEHTIPCTYRELFTTLVSQSEPTICSHFVIRYDNDGATGMR